MCNSEISPVIDEELCKMFIFRDINTKYKGTIINKQSEQWNVTSHYINV